MHRVHHFLALGCSMIIASSAGADVLQQVPMSFNITTIPLEMGCTWTRSLPGMRS